MVLPDSYSVLLVPTDSDSDNLFVETVINMNTLDDYENFVVLSLTMKLRRRSLWNHRVLAYGCSQHPMTNVSELSEF